MRIRSLAPEEHAAVLALIDAGLRRPGAATGPRDDFPHALGPGNRHGLIVLEEAGELRACLCTLTRTFVTSAGLLPVGMIGSVVTARAHRGRGLSARLQEAAVARLTASGAALAVLWSDRPAVYAARGFVPAGCEYHLSLDTWRPAATARGWRARPYGPADAARVHELYERHGLHTRREPDESALLHGMPGTRGLVLERGGPAAYVFCGKGQDFPGYAAEWGGAPPDVAALLAHARAAGLARHVLVPQGGEALGALLEAEGAVAAARPSGLWRVLGPGRLASALAPQRDADPEDPRAWLGDVAEDGSPRPGPLRLAVWGLDSI